MSNCHILYFDFFFVFLTAYCSQAKRLQLQEQVQPLQPMDIIAEMKATPVNPVDSDIDN